VKNGQNTWGRVCPNRVHLATTPQKHENFASRNVFTAKPNLAQNLKCNHCAAFVSLLLHVIRPVQQRQLATQKNTFACWLAQVLRHTIVNSSSDLQGFISANKGHVAKSQTVCEFRTTGNSGLSDCIIFVTNCVSKELAANTGETIMHHLRAISTQLPRSEPYVSRPRPNLKFT
jgi:hypothetical protein